MGCLRRPSLTYTGIGNAEFQNYEEPFLMGGEFFADLTSAKTSSTGIRGVASGSIARQPTQ
jgi:hypothetical protein